LNISNLISFLRKDHFYWTFFLNIHYPLFPLESPVFIKGKRFKVFTGFLFFPYEFGRLSYGFEISSYGLKNSSYGFAFLSNEFTFQRTHSW